MKKLYFVILTLAVICFNQNTKAADYYWVGGTGNWSDFATHWATTSGGVVFHLAEPGPADSAASPDRAWVARCAAAGVTIVARAACAARALHAPHAWRARFSRAVQ